MNVNHDFVVLSVAQGPCKVGEHLLRAGPELGGADRAMDTLNAVDRGPWGPTG